MEYEFHWNIVFQKLPQLLNGAFVTLHVSVLSMLIGIAIAVLLAIAKMSDARIFSLPATVWVEIARNTPALFQIYMAYFGLGAFGIHLSPYAAVLSALVFVNAGYLTETFRGGFQSIPKTQYSASKSLGMSSTQLYRYIILPQMFRRIYHPMTNQFVWSILMSSLGILVGMNELSGETQRLQSLSFRTLEFFIVAAVMYFLITKFVLFSAALISQKVFKGEL
ncbi:MAG: amino acid ABC transporter permease [Chromatiaceae bacterium]|nr:amino acid ABC transporter permease [Gammaproteobacteria bacterium]MCP5427675.1 amino acid ABC transporter permease [Chromatiaceae bacterium]MCB1862988.1 amino acid ABC transporter permease [Gammaproteobacteria bacterium]MCB1870967.1 amino acid ABC transporter permease [Gammaproteobacteria bacterium]MCB1881249.1 amino acid ABC transporter permease [Gammaproteobacteria bacterium]